MLRGAITPSSAALQTVPYTPRKSPCRTVNSRRHEVGEEQHHAGGRVLEHEAETGGRDEAPDRERQQFSPQAGLENSPERDGRRHRHDDEQLGHPFHSRDNSLVRRHFPGDTWMSLLRRLVGGSAKAAEPHGVAPADADSAEAGFIRAAFWMVLGRPVKTIELRDELREFQSGDEQPFLLRLLSSTEFRHGFTRWRNGRDRQRDPAIEEAALGQFGTDDEFVQRAYELLLGRPADEDGRRHYVDEIAAGGTRAHVLRSLALSEEFGQRYLGVAPQSGFVPRDTQLCELANPAKWDNPDWMQLLRDLKVVPVEKPSMHRKGYEFTQLLYGLTRLGRLHDGIDILSVGAGHEAILVLAGEPRRIGGGDRSLRRRPLGIVRRQGRRRARHQAAGRLRAVCLPPGSAGVPQDGRPSSRVRRPNLRRGLFPLIDRTLRRAGRRSGGRATRWRAS